MKRNLYPFPPGSLLGAAALFTLLVLFVPCASSFEAPLQDDPACRFCSDTGWIPCKKHSKGDLETEKLALFCSEMIRCSRCGGTLKVNCPKCRKEEIAFGTEESIRDTDFGMKKTWGGVMEMHTYDKNEMVDFIEQNNGKLIDIVENKEAGKRFESYRYCVGRRE